MISTLISSQTLSSHLNDPDWLVVDCRFDLTDPEWGLNQYTSSHIPGAIYAHLNTDLSAPVTPTRGRHPLPDPQTAAQQLAALGIRDQHQVVVYDHLGGAFAARLWWMLRWLGHDAAAVLNGGWQAWLEFGGAVEAGAVRLPPGSLTPRVHQNWTVDTGMVERIRQDPEWRLVDARAPVRFRGEQEPIDTFAGHIPGSINRFHGQNLDPQGLFLAPDILRQQFTELLAGAPPDQTVVYCGSGVTSCHHLLALEVAGLPGAKLYPGSWSEWIRDLSRPREPKQPAG